MKTTSRRHAGLSCAGICVVVLLSLSCQYEYISPQPGILEIRLKTKNSRTNLMPFGVGSSLMLNMKSLEARTGNARLDILPDLQAIRRDLDGEIINALDTLARDSSRILGRAYAPPATYSSIEINLLFFPPEVVVSGVGQQNVLRIVSPQPEPGTLKKLPRLGQSLGVVVTEGKTTRVTIMLDLDSSLVRRSEYFLGTPQLYLSSIQTF